MSNDDDLYTDYALQMFSSFVSQDLDSMQTVLESFKNEELPDDPLFLPGVIYGLMYHMSMVFKVVSELSGTPIEKLLQSYAMDYAVVRDELKKNLLLNVKHSREQFASLREELLRLEEQLGNLDEDF